MIGVPLPHSHTEGVDVLVELVELDVELDLGATVRVAETELGLVAGHGSEAFDKLGE